MGYGAGYGGGPYHGGGGGGGQERATRTHIYTYIFLDNEIYVYITRTEHSIFNPYVSLKRNMRTQKSPIDLPLNPKVIWHP